MRNMVKNENELNEYLLGWFPKLKLKLKLKEG